MGLCGAILVFAPLAYGAVHTWSYFTVALVASTLVLILLAAAIYWLWARPEQALFLPHPPLWGAVVAGLILVLCQIIPLPQVVTSWVSPMALDIRSLGNSYGMASYLPLSLNPYATMLEGLKLWPVVAIFYVLLYTINSRHQLQALVGIILATALFEVIYGFAHFHNHLIWGWKNFYTDNRLCGTFVNSNHLAAYLTMAILVGFGLVMAQWEVVPRLAPGLTKERRLRLWSRAEHLEPRVQQFILLFLLLLLTVALIFTGSRGGMLSLITGFVLMGLAIWSQRWKKGHLFLIGIFVLAAILYSLWLGSAPLLTRFLDTEHSGRYSAFKGALVLWREFPWLGTGLGTFGEIFYRLEPASLRGTFFIHTHNDWLQLLAETGLLGFSIMAGAWLLFINHLLRQWRSRRDPFARGLGLGGLAALVAGAFHALGEFPFHITGFTLTYSAIAAITYITLFHHGENGGFEYFTYTTVKFSGNRLMTWAICLGLMGLQLAYIGEVWHYWQAERMAPTEIDSTRPVHRLTVEDWQQALGYNSHNSRYYLGLAQALETAVPQEPKNIREEDRLLRQAVFRAPAHWRCRLTLADFYVRHYIESPDRYLPQALLEYEAAVQLFPESGLLHYRLGTILAWAEEYHTGLIPPELRHRVGYHLEQAFKLEPQLKKLFNKKKG
ncbi:MAG: O-antigen ligase family protein [Syntrophales bacterium]|nr:O-antigen ligase family protein [Syntrophales bacterium]MDD5641701.1 O-antigen ligase family protein [Syntrophales bacterium]